MHQDIEKLLNAAKEKGFITEKQREIIIDKAKQIGEDITEVEFILEDIPIKAGANEKTKTKKCPNCGALIYDTLISCPECGYVFQNESSASVEAKALIDNLKKQLELAQETGSTFELFLNPYKTIDKQVNIINSFSLPTTKEGLLYLMDFAYSNYVAIENSMTNIDKRRIKKAWYAKCVQTYNMLCRYKGDDKMINNTLERYSDLIKKEKWKLSGYAKLWILIAALVAVFALIVSIGMNSENKEKVVNEVKICLSNNDFQCAKMAVNKLSGEEKENLYDDVITQEATYLVSQGEIDQAIAVVSTMYSGDKRQQLLNTINSIKKQ